MSRFRFDPFTSLSAPAARGSAGEGVALGVAFGTDTEPRDAAAALCLGAGVLSLK